jgi:hypothetical protein
MRPLAAKEQLAVRREAPGLIPGLCARGLSLEDAVALSHNITLITYAGLADPAFSSPEEVLDRLSLEEIAAACARYADNSGEEIEQGWNENFGEDLA